MDRRVIAVAGWVATSLGCALPETLEDACPEKFPGYEELPGEAIRLVRRISCHRRYVGLSNARINRTGQLAAESHVVYLEQNGVLDPASEHYARSLADYFVEDLDLPGSTGIDVRERLIVAGDNRVTEGTGTWEAIFDLSRNADELFRDPFLRDVFFQPAWISAGVAVTVDPTTGGDVGYMNLLYGAPPGVRVLRPVVYPRDGQEDVPTQYVPAPVQGNPLYVADVIGFPITVTVGSDHISARVNPYDLHVVSADLTDGGGGTVPLIVVEPREFPWGTLSATAIFAPQIPLRDNDTFTFEAEITWNAGSKTISTTFSTSTDALGVP